MLNTNLKHVDTDEEYRKVLSENENVMLCCGREGPMCLPVYDVMESLEGRYSNVAFRDMAFDGPASHNIKRLPEVRGFAGLPFTIYYRKGQVVAATTSIQTKAQVTEILDRVFGKPESKAA